MSVTPNMNGVTMSWLAIIRCGLVQTALGAIVVLMTSTLNRVMVVELALPAMLPGALVAWHYAVQLSRPRWGYGSDGGRRRTPWIIGGMAVLALGAISAAAATMVMEYDLVAGIALAVFAFTLIGGGVGASGTSLLAFLATSVKAERRAPAATIVWLMMIAGMVLTATLAGKVLDPFSPERLLIVCTGVCAIAMVLTVIGIWGTESRILRGQSRASEPRPAPAERPPFRTALAEVWSEPQARQFTIFVFVSMLAYSAQDLILEPFAGLVFGMTPGESTQLSGLQNGGVLIGMILVAVLCSSIGRNRFGSVRAWTIAGCLGSALALLALVGAAIVGPGWPLKPSVFGLGFANGVFAVAAIASMMSLAGSGRESREGVRMGLWGAAQAIAFGLGGFLGTVVVDVMRALFDGAALAYGSAFALEGLVFLMAAILAARVGQGLTTKHDSTATGPTGLASGTGRL